MGAALSNDQSNPPSEQTSWRDGLLLRAAKASALLYGLGTLVILVTVHGQWQRHAMVISGIGCCLLSAVVAYSSWPSSRYRPWCIIAPAVATALAGFAMVGFLAGPAVLLTVNIMLGGLLLGRRAMALLLLVTVFGIGAIAWAMVSNAIPAPPAASVSMTHVVPWLRTIAVMALATGLLGSLLIDIVGRMERSVEQAKQETHRREEAERDRAQAEIMSLANKQLETIGQLAAGVAHDFNNNLSVILGSTELLREEVGDNPAAVELIDDVLHSSRRAAELTRQLLAYSRKAQMVLSPTDINQLVEAAVALLRRSIDPGVQIKTSLLATNSSVMADSTLLENALLNLMVNARDAMPHGGQLTVVTSDHVVDHLVEKRTHGLAPGTYTLVEILDTGDGIASEHLPHIFEPFFTTKPIGKGTGLGLAAVSGTIKSLKGSIEVVSEPGCGTAFRILLPCSKLLESTRRSERNQVVKGSGVILLVDDDATVRRSAAATLANLGYRVTTAEDGLDAMEKIRLSSEPFKLVILDLRMPRMNGETTFDRIMAVTPNLPVVVWSGYGGDQDVEALLRKGAAGFIQKPYSIAELSQAVSVAISGRAQQRQTIQSA